MTQIGETSEDLLAEEIEVLALDKFRPTPHVAAGGSTRAYALALIIGGVVGMFSSIQLVVAEMQLLANPGADLSCDLNPLVACGSSLLEWQSQLLFGWPNALVGAAVFGLVTGIGVALLSGARLATWLWRLMALTVLAGVGFVAWFALQSLTALGVLCPWCMVAWAVVLVLAPQTLGAAARGGHLPVGSRVARSLYLDRVLITVVLYMILIVAILGVFWNQWLALLR